MMIVDGARVDDVIAGRAIVGGASAGEVIAGGGAPA